MPDRLLGRLPPTPINTEEYEDRIGAVSLRALQQGGEPLLDRVTHALGVASRHLERLRVGQLTLVPAVKVEIEESFARAEQLLNLGNVER